MKDYKKMWIDLYKYLDNWSAGISLDYNDSDIYDTVRRLSKSYTISTIMDEMMDLETDASETEPEILRCKDCANYELKGYCNTLQMAVSPFSYCDKAKEVKNDL